MTAQNGVDQNNRETCYFCGSDGPIESHHIIPRRFGGGDYDDNLVDLCPTCHQRLERLYDSEFYTALGVTDQDEQVAKILGGVADDLQMMAKQIRSQYIRSDIEDAVQAATQDATDDDESDESSPNHQEVKIVKEAISDVSDGDGADRDAVISALQDGDIDEDEAKQMLRRCKYAGEIYEPQKGTLRST